MRARTLCRLVLVGVGLGLAIGCGGPAAKPVDTFPVTGTVTLDGDPVEGATVTFVPTKGGRAAAGETDASGKYSLATFEAGDGAAAGEYNVRVAKYEGGDEVAAETGEGDEGMEDESYDGEAGGGGSENVLPEKYNQQIGSGLTASVTEGDNTFDFALESGG